MLICPLPTLSIPHAPTLLVLAVYPDLSEHKMEVSAAYVNGMLGLQLSAADIAKLLSKMQLDVSVKPDGATLAVAVPPTRSDILHAVDVAEDVAIAHGYNNIPKRVSERDTRGTRGHAGVRVPVCLSVHGRAVRGGLPGQQLYVSTHVSCHHAFSIVHL